MITKRRIWMLVCLPLIFLRLGVSHGNAARLKPEPTTPIRHLIVLMQQNHTYDNYFGRYPAGDGLPAGICIPVDPFEPDRTECIQPYPIRDNPVADLDHSTSTFQEQYNEGSMDGFVFAQDKRGQDGRISMGFYDDQDIPYYWNLADEYVLFDRFFSSAFGGSVWNRMFWVAGVPGNEKNSIPEEGFGDIPTIFDRLEERGISWKFYVNNYDPNLTYRTLGDTGVLDPQVQWVPLLGFDRFIESATLSSHIVDMDQYFYDLANGTLPAVSYMLALGATEHPLTSLESGQQFSKKVIQALMQSEAWYHSAFLLTYDDWGGWYDHVPPPQIDEYGYGFRVPALLISPYAPRGHIDSTVLDFTSILRFIEDNWSVQPLASRDAQANSLASAFDFSSPPRDPAIIPWERPQPASSMAVNIRVIQALYGTALTLAIGVIMVILVAKKEAPNVEGRGMRDRNP